MSRRDPASYSHHGPSSAALCPKVSPGAGPIGVTIATADGHMELAAEAVKRWTKYTGLPGIIVQAGEGGYWTKYDLADLFPNRKICYFDADLWMVRKPPLEDLWPAGGDWDVQAVQDCAIRRPTDFPCQDIDRFHLDREQYFNTGWFTMDTSRPGPKRWLDHARRLTLDVAAGLHRKPVDDTEQTLLNLAAQLLPEPELRVQLVSSAWNWLRIGHYWGQTPLPRDVWNAHAAGYRLEDKREVLESMARVFGAHHTV